MTVASLAKQYSVSKLVWEDTLNPKLKPKCKISDKTRHNSTSNLR